MNPSRSHLSNGALSQSLRSRFRNEELNAGEMLADLAEFDERKLYLPAGYQSMRAYCVGEFHVSEDSAHKRIRAARTARQYPAIFTAVAEGRLHVSGVLTLSSYLTRENTEELIAAATHKTRFELELLLAQRFPRADVPTRIEPIASPSTLELAPGPVDASVDQSSRTSETSSEVAPGPPQIMESSRQVAPGQLRERESSRSLPSDALSKPPSR